MNFGIDVGRGGYTVRNEILESTLFVLLQTMCVTLHYPDASLVAVTFDFLVHF